MCYFFLIHPFNSERRRIQVANTCNMVVLIREAYRNCIRIDICIFAPGRCGFHHGCLASETHLGMDRTVADAGWLVVVSNRIGRDEIRWCRPVHSPAETCTRARRRHAPACMKGFLLWHDGSISPLACRYART